MRTYAINKTDLTKITNNMQENDKAFSSIDFVGQCLVDEKRTESFKKTIKKVVKRNAVVLDLGTGSGIMALFAAKSGAKKVFAVEYDPFIASIAKNNFTLNGYNKKISLLVKDARDVKFPKGTKFTVVTSEMLTTGVVDEHQIQSINNLHKKKLVDKSTVFIPQRQDTFISLINADYNFFGLRIPMIFHLWRWHNWRSLKLKKMSEDTLLNSLDFRSTISDKFDKIIEIQANEPGLINGIYLTSKSILQSNIILGDTEAMNAPMLIPVKQKRVKVGQKIKVKIRYIFGGSYSNFKVEII